MRRQKAENLVNKGFGGGWGCLGPEGEGRKEEARGKGYGSARGQKFWMQKQEAEGREAAVCYICAVLWENVPILNGTTT